MQDPIAYLNGRMLPAAEARLSVVDAGFVLGTTIAEQLRTFGGAIFHVEEHLARMTHSLGQLELELPLPADRLAEIIREVAAHNHGLLQPGDDLGVSVFVTPGEYAGYGGDPAASPTLCVHTYPLPFHFWAEKYATGQAVVTTPVRQVPRNCWPREVKGRSRMHYYLADRAAARREAHARAILLDQDGEVTEASTANVLVYRAAEGMLSPPEEKVLRGVSVHMLRELAAARAIATHHRALLPDDLATADEAWLSSTPFCLLPITRFNSRPLADGQPGPVFRRLLADWSAQVGVDIAGQAARFAKRETLGGPPTV